MPPKKIISYQQIIEKAFELVREQGVGVLSARTLAKELNCSTQPIYNSFRDMTDLKRILIHKAIIMMQNNLDNKETNNSELLNKILGYVQFADKEPNLFQLIFTSGDCGDNDILKLIPKDNEVEFNMIVYANGIIMMKAFGTLPLEWSQIRELILKAFESFNNKKC